MNRTITALMLVSLAAMGFSSAQAAGRVAIDRSSGGGREMNTSGMGHMQRSISGARSASAPTSIVRDHARASYPSTYERGGRITARAAVSPPSQHSGIVRNSAIVRSIQSHQRLEIVPNHYYWHNDRGVRYCHYYNDGIHWYGFYNGPSFYWTRYYDGYWWWFDVNFDRWVYWQNGTWCWPGPDGVIYDYVDNNYYPVDDDDTVAVNAPDVSAPPQNIPAPVTSAAAPASEGSVVKSADGKRMVQVVGSNAEAYLYDTSSTQPMYMKYLGKNVEKVRFAGGANG
jgi:hypothetical protein